MFSIMLWTFSTKFSQGGSTGAKRLKYLHRAFGCKWPADLAASLSFLTIEGVVSAIAIASMA